MTLQETQEIQIKIPSLTQTFGVYEQITMSLSSFWQENRMIIFFLLYQIQTQATSHCMDVLEPKPS